MISKDITARHATLAQMMLRTLAMPRRSHLHAVSRRSFFVETRATDLLPDEQSGVRALPKASLPPPHPATLGNTELPMLLSPVAHARTLTRFVPELRLEQSEYQVPSEASMRLLLERAQRKARIKQAAAEASMRLAQLLREQEETYREEMVWRAKLREAKQRLEQEAERKASLTAAKAQRAIAQRDECLRQEEAEWQAVIFAARHRHR